VKITVATTVTVEKQRHDGDELVESHTYVHVRDQGDSLAYLAEGAAIGLVEVGNRVLAAIELANGVHPLKRAITLRPVFREPEPHQP
jgi:hypothetical protein